VFRIAKLGLFRNIERSPATQTADISPKQLQQAGEYTNQFKEEIEMGLDVGIRNGVPANKMTRDLKQYLRHPDKLFRRVRDEHGQLQLSKAAKAYHPGRGVYRSSYKNARRLTATETNMAYRTADYERWQQLDFVVGIKIEPSVNNHETDICDDLAGKYPKDFKWTGWHPHCRCHALTILKTEKELDADTERILNGEEPSQESVNKVEAMPENFSKWVTKNQERIEKAKSLPYWIKDNKKTMDVVIEAAKEGKQEDNTLTALADAIGVKVGQPMTFDEANHLKPNPNYSRGGMYATNCQSSAVAYELRRRGLPVEAFGNNKAEWYMPHELGKRPEAAWLTKDGNIPMSMIVKDKINAAKLGESMKEEGRYQLWFNWNGQNKGHIITAERLADGSLRYYDTQSGMSASDFLFDFARLDTAEGVRIMNMNDLRPNESLINGIVKAAGSKAKAPRMSMEQMSWWLENAQGATSFMGEFKPYSNEIIKQLKKCNTKAQRNNLFESVARGKEAEVINDTGKAFTTCYPEHRSMKGETWKNTRQTAVDLNNSGISVCFLPEYKDKISADAIVKVADSWRLADFKCSLSVKSNTIAPDIAHAFEQAEHCVIKITKADKGIICEALDYLRRNNKRTGSFTFVNKYGKCKNITKSDFEQKKFWKLLKGFFR
jgi:hypothetical protein